MPSGKPSQYFLPAGGSLSASGASGLGGGTSCVQLSPPSRETYRPLPGPPLVSSHGRRRACHIPANSTFGLLGSKQTSEAPVSLSFDSTFCHVLPPSVVR